MLMCLSWLQIENVTNKIPWFRNCFKTGHDPINLCLKNIVFQNCVFDFNGSKLQTKLTQLNINVFKQNSSLRIGSRDNPIKQMPN